jgi:hypothetical protein
MGFATGPEQAIGLGLTICCKWLGPPLWRGSRTERRLGYHWVLTKLVGDDLEVMAAALYFQYEFGATSISGGYAWICGMLDRVGHRSTLTAAGEIVYRRALRILAERDDLMSELDEV